MLLSYHCAGASVQVPEHGHGCSSGGLQDQAPVLEGDKEQPADVSAPDQGHESGPPEEAQPAADAGNAQQTRVAAPEDIERAASLKVHPCERPGCRPFNLRQPHLYPSFNQPLALVVSGGHNRTQLLPRLLHVGVFWS